MRLQSSVTRHMPRNLLGPGCYCHGCNHVDGRAVAAQIACEYDDEFFLESQNLRVYLMMFRILGVAVDREKGSGEMDE